MTDTERDHFSAVRRELLDATLRSARRSERRRRAAVTAAAIVGSLLLLTGLAAAASDRAATAVGKVTATMLPDVFHGEPEITEPPSNEAKETLNGVEGLMRGVDPGDPGATREYGIESRVLLREEVDGVEVEIVAYERPVGSPSSVGARKRAETCWSVRTDEPLGEGGVTCSPVFMPALHINYSAETASSCEGSAVTLAGIAAQSVRAVRFETPDGIEDAAMGDGAFWWRSETAPTTVHVELVDGSTVSRPYRFGPLPAPQEMGCD